MVSNIDQTFRGHQLQCWRVQLIRYTIFTILSCLSFSVQAQYLNGTISASLGNAGVASNDDGEAQLNNPALLVHTKGLAFSSFYNFGAGSPHKGIYDSKTYGFSLSENSEGTSFPGSFSYFRKNGRVENSKEFSEDYLQLSLARFFFGQWSVGTSFSRLSTEVQGDQYTQWDSTFGFVFNPHPDWALGLTYNHVLSAAEKGLPTVLELKPRLTVGGTWLAQDFLRVRGDLSYRVQDNPELKWIYRLGFESFFNDFSILRIGFEQDDQLDESLLSMGIGLKAPRFLLDYAYSQIQGFENSAMHSVDLRVPFW